MEIRAMQTDENHIIAAFTGGALVASLSSIKIWLIHINLASIPLDAIVKVGVLLAASFAGGIAGRASKQFYDIIILPRFEKFLAKFNVPKKPKK